MSRSREFDDYDFQPSVPFRTRLKRWAILTGVISFAALIVFLLLWNTFFVYVPPGKYLVIISKHGAEMPPGQVLAGPGQKGIQEEVKGEGWHFVTPVVYTTERHDNTVVPAGKVGIVTAKGGEPLPPGQVLAEKGQQGIQREVLPPGTYRLNKYGYDIELVDATTVKPGYVGVRRRLVGKDGKGRFTAENKEEKGILPKVLQPGMYYLNPKEYEVIMAEVGIFQTTFAKVDDTAITFTSKGGFNISMDCTIEWEVLPENMPALVAEYGSRKKVEKTVIDLQAHAIPRDKGIDYGAQDLLEGVRREQFQADFSKELTRVCKDKGVLVHSAFIRNIEIPEQYLKPIREKQIAAETELTNEAKRATAQSEAQVEREQQMIQQHVAEVEADTKRLVASIDRDVENVKILTDAEIEKLKAEYAAQIAALEAQQKQVVGEAEATVTKLKETAQSSIYQMKMEVFQNDGNAYLRYTLAEKLNPQMRLRLFHSGPGTLWTNLDGKNLQMLLPAPGTAPEKATAAPTK
jgi:regulator of protease activity HflC (stomatin/prohibitin superfamily)